MNTVASTFRSRPILIPTNADFLAFSGRLYDAMAEIRQAPAPRPPKHSKRRPSVKHMVKELEKLGKHVTGIEVATDGTTRILTGNENVTTEDYWDRKLKS